MLRLLRRYGAPFCICSLIYQLGIGLEHRPASPHRSMCRRRVPHRTITPTRCVCVGECVCAGTTARLRPHGLCLTAEDRVAGGAECGEQCRACAAVCPPPPGGAGTGSEYIAAVSLHASSGRVCPTELDAFRGSRVLRSSSAGHAEPSTMFATSLYTLTSDA